MLIGILPKIIAKFKHVNFIIGGDGGKMLILKSLIEKHNLQNRVELLGGLKHTEVRGVLNRGHIFLNCSLTESFCIAILEAALCNLTVVSTNVGGVPEVLPPRMCYLSDINERDLYRQLSNAIVNFNANNNQDFHNELKSIYCWHKVAERTEKVYDYIM